MEADIARGASIVRVTRVPRGRHRTRRSGREGEAPRVKNRFARLHASPRGEQIRGSQWISCHGNSPPPNQRNQGGTHKGEFLFLDNSRFRGLLALDSPRSSRSGPLSALHRRPLRRRVVVASRKFLFVSTFPSTSRAAGSHGLQRCLLYTSPSPRDGLLSRMPSSA